jgi:hypothetical protein
MAFPDAATSIRTPCTHSRQLSELLRFLPSCDCGELVHLSGEYGIRVPCSYQYSLGAEKPSVPDAFDVSFPVTRPECVHNIRKVDRERPGQLPVRTGYLKNLAA